MLAATPYLDVAIARYGLDPALIFAQTFVESSFRPDAFLNDRNGGSYGLMQMSLPTAQGLGYTGPAAGLYDPATNVDLGCKLMAQLLARFGGDESSALAAYNAGPNNLAAGQGYAAKVLQAAAEFSDQWAQLQGGTDPAADVIVVDDGASSTGGGVLLDLVVMLAGFAVVGFLFKRFAR
jgi:soluble lytic murein transglycosylase-like protein